LTPNEQLYNKLSAEFDAYVESLKVLPPEKIISSAYEKVFKEDLLMCFEDSDNLNDREVAALLALDEPLDELYRNWLDTDVSYMDDLRDTILGFAVREVQRGKEAEREPIADVADQPITTVTPEPERPVMAVNGELSVEDWVVVNTTTTLYLDSNFFVAR
jgi:hypothetical protein